MNTSPESPSLNALFAVSNERRVPIGSAFSQQRYLNNVFPTGAPLLDVLDEALAISRNIGELCGFGEEESQGLGAEGGGRAEQRGSRVRTRSAKKPSSANGRATQ